MAGDVSNETTLFQRFMQGLDSNKIADNDKSDAHEADDKRAKIFQNIVNKLPLVERFSKDFSGKAGGRGLISEAANFTLFMVDVTKKLIYQSVKQPTMMAYQAVMGAGSLLRLGFNLSQYPAKAFANLGITLYNKALSKKLTPYKLSEGLPETKEFFRNFTYRASEFLKATAITAVLAGVAISIPATFGVSIPVISAAASTIPGVGAALGFVSHASGVVSSSVMTQAVNPAVSVATPIVQSGIAAATPIVQSGIAAANSAVSAVTSGLNSVSATATAYGLPAASSNSTANGAVYASGGLVAGGVARGAGGVALVRGRKLAAKLFSTKKKDEKEENNQETLESSEELKALFIKTSKEITTGLKVLAEDLKKRVEELEGENKDKSTKNLQNIFNQNQGNSAETPTPPPTASQRGKNSQRTSRK